MLGKVENSVQLLELVEPLSMRVNDRSLMREVINFIIFLALIKPVRSNDVNTVELRVAAKLGRVMIKNDLHEIDVEKLCDGTFSSDQGNLHLDYFNGIVAKLGLAWKDNVITMFSEYAFDQDHGLGAAKDLFRLALSDYTGEMPSDVGGDSNQRFVSQDTNYFIDQIQNPTDFDDKLAAKSEAMKYIVSLWTESPSDGSTLFDLVVVNSFGETLVSIQDIDFGIETANNLVPSLLGMPGFEKSFEKLVRVVHETIDHPFMPSYPETEAELQSLWILIRNWALYFKT